MFEGKLVFFFDEFNDFVVLYLEGDSQLVLKLGIDFLEYGALGGFV